MSAFGQILVDAGRMVVLRQHVAERLEHLKSQMKHWDIEPLSEIDQLRKDGGTAVLRAALQEVEKVDQILSFDGR